MGHFSYLTLLSQAAGTVKPERHTCSQRQAQQQNLTELNFLLHVVGTGANERATVSTSANNQF